MTTIEPKGTCTALVYPPAWALVHVLKPYRCGEPVAERDHPYQGRLVHVSPAGLCATCELQSDAHDGDCPYCVGTGEIPANEGYPRPCYGCLTGEGPHGHEYAPAYVEVELGHDPELATPVKE